MLKIKSPIKEKIIDHSLRILNWFYPNRCAACRGDLSYDDKRHLCYSCRDSIRPIPDPCCVKCGVHLPDAGMHCYHCKRQKYHFSYVRSATIFDAVLRDTVHQFKYFEKETLAKDLSELLYEAWKRYPEIQDVQLIISVPLYSSNRRERGFNQSELLAKELMNLLKEYCADESLCALPQLLTYALVRTKKTISQTNLSREKRFFNVESAFEIRDNSAIRSKNILLIDDVCTTGATLDECAKVLKKAGAKKVYGLTLARD